MKLLREYNALSYDTKVIKEEKARTGKIILKGILQKADTLNQNARLYPHAILEREISNFQKFIRERRSTGELDHPQDSVINLKNVSHLITEAYMDNQGVVYGSIELLNTPSGLIAQQLVEAGVTLGISSRGVGSTKKQGESDVVQDDFVLLTWDLVSEPSTPNAFLMREGRDISPLELRQVMSKQDRIYREANSFIQWAKRLNDR